LRTVIEVSDDQSRDKRLLAILHDAMVACIWAAVVLYALTLLSWAVFLATRETMLVSFARMYGVSENVFAILWLCGVALMKLTALSFAAMAFGLWIWRRRQARRMAG
jgi:hypothetical protein